MKLNLLVLKTDNLEPLAEFYNLLGIEFEYHKHDRSPMHYSGKIGDLILEIYPLAKLQQQADSNLRIGFQLDDFDSVIAQLKNKKISFISEPTQTEFGYMAVVKDSDGRKVELYKTDE